MISKIPFAHEKNISLLISNIAPFKSLQLQKHCTVSTNVWNIAYSASYDCRYARNRRSQRTVRYFMRCLSSSQWERMQCSRTNETHSDAHSNVSRRIRSKTTGAINALQQCIGTTERNWGVSVLSHTQKSCSAPPKFSLSSDITAPIIGVVSSEKVRWRHWLSSDVLPTDSSRTWLAFGVLIPNLLHSYVIDLWLFHYSFKRISDIC